MCLCLLVKTDAADRREVLLGRKKTSLGTGKFVGLGGQFETDETPVEAAVREVFEESGISVKVADLDELGVVTFRFRRVLSGTRW